ncbi:MAG: efflux RND transporter permease subunit [Anaeromicrobium sp.]|jgi:multidrug efflux pump subunit AcrB|uniref:efflux RND transporter permease subunit n=1 Tax=Anaeromicrobium sp. TaxID=1929132 RepID=UPI0025E0FEE9|nr:efflux RND transporter permease subunit [Anaeromicrobium sp.]MCT4594448.1 efflux RND transporter permease subunit [Anaeromicrobium sp.]
MNTIIKKLIEKRVITMFLAVIIGLVGVYSYYILPRQESPDVSAPYAMVITPYPGANPKDVKELVTKKIEDKMVELDGFEKAMGTSKEGLSIIVVKFDADADNDKAMQDVRNAIEDVRRDLPTGIMGVHVDTDLVKSAGIIISLSGENYTYEQLESFGELFKNELSTAEGISKFTIEGKLDKEVKVDIDIRKLNEIDLGIDEIDKILKAQNLEIPTGDIDYDGDKITVKTPGIFTSTKDIENTIVAVSPQNGNVLRLKDIANIYVDLEEGAAKYKQNGKNAVLLTGYFKENKNVVLIGKDVRKIIDNVKRKLPPDLVVEEVVYQPKDVSDSVNDFMLSLVEGIVLVIIVVFLGMGLRNALVVSTSIPLCILMTFGIMFLMKIKIHQMSLTALIIALGILVDNAIVISDTIQVRIDKGESNELASLKGTSMSSIPIFTATLTTIAAFSPLLGLPGAAGDFLLAIPQVLIISIIGAYVVAMFITPSMATIFFKPTGEKVIKKQRLRGIFHKSLEESLKRKKTVVISIFIVLLITVKVIMPMLPSEFFPYVDKDLVYIDMYSENIANMEATERLTDHVVEVLNHIPEITNYTVAVGDGLPKFYLTMPPATPSSDYGQMLCKFDLTKGDNRFKSKLELLDHIQSTLDENIPEGKCTAKLLANAVPKEAKIIVRMSGENLDRLMEVANTMKKEVSKLEGTTNVRHDMKDKVYQIQVDIDEDKAISMGITKYDIQKQINMALYGKVSSVYRRDGSEYNIKIESNIKDTALLSNMKIKSSITGKKVPLKQFAKINYSNKLDTIKTFNREQSIELLANELPGYNAASIENRIENELLPKLDLTGVNVTFDGEREDIKEYFSVAGVLAGFTVILIYIILVIQFNSFIQPVVILMTIPLSIIGSVIGLYFFKKPLSLTAFLGIIALIGLVVKNGILLIEYINEGRNEGHSIDEACIDAVDKRFNAIILSAVTTIMGLVPLAIGNSSLFSPMAISLMFGLAASTFLTMIVIPVIYSLIETFRENKKIEA